MLQKGQRSVRDILNIMHNMPSTLNDIGISPRTAEAIRAAKLTAWKAVLQDWRDVGPHTTSWTADRDDHARELSAQQQEFNENPFSDEHLQMRWAMMAKSELLEGTTDEEASKALHDLSWIDLTEPDPKHNGAAMRNERLAPIWKEEQGNEMTGLSSFRARLLEKDQAKQTAHGYKGHLIPLPLQDQATLCGRAQTEG